VALTAAERAWCVVVPHHPRGAGQARSRLAAEIGRVVRPELLADVVSVAAELVGNAVRHATPLPGGVIRVAWLVRLTADTQTVEVRVTDGGASTEPRVRTHDSDSTDGRGLSIVAALAERWGFERDGLGQCVWARITHPSRGRAAATTRSTATAASAGD
jgi:anti-sigma regulatory factor (Ser/Thr protein kinase)